MPIFQLTDRPSLPRDIASWAERKGYAAAVAGLEFVDMVKAILEDRRSRGEFAPGFFEENLEIFDDKPSGALGDPRSILLVAVPAPAWILKFQLEDGAVETILPPTYVQYRPMFKRIRSELADEVLRGLAGIEILKAPLKSLAVAMGLAFYGRNNLTYIPEFGSYYQLAGYVLDRPIEPRGGPFRIDRKLDRCESCRACIKACPRDAISEDRFLIRADRCYTLLSESARPIPEDVEPPSPDCLIGCLKCQAVCPANKGRLRREISPISFTAEETAAFAGKRDISNSRLDESIRAKFAQLAMSEDLPIFRRNLSRLLNNRSRK